MRSVIMPMAGRGQRLKTIAPEKVLHSVAADGKPLFVLAAENLGFHYDKIVFVCRKEHRIPALAKVWLRGPAKLSFVELQEETLGPLDSALRALPELDYEDELVIANSDQVMDWPGDWALDWFQRRGAVGGIPTVERNTDRHSYAEIDPDYPHRILRVKEKERISSRATIGIYWFRTVQAFAEAGRACIQEPKGGLPEYYVGPAYNKLKGLVLEYPLCEFWSLGEPQNLAAYLRRDHGAAAKD